MGTLLVPNVMRFLKGDIGDRVPLQKNAKITHFSSINQFTLDGMCGILDYRLTLKKREND
jgi:hypothetical protein